MAATSAKAGFGSVFKMETGTPGTFDTIAEVMNITPPSRTVGFADATNMGSPDGFREFIPTVLESGDVSLALNFLGNDTTQVALETAMLAKTKKLFQIEFPSSPQKRFEFSGYVMEISEELPFDGKMTRTVKLKVTGKTEIEATA